MTDARGSNAKSPLVGAGSHAGIGVCTTPVGPQLSIVQTLESSIGSTTPWHPSAVHWSLAVQAEPSSHETLWQVGAGGSAIGVPAHTPFVH